MGNPDHNAVVYTPCHTDEAGLHTYDFTLPVGMICTDILPRLGDWLILCKACSADGLCALLMVSAVSLSVLAKHSGPVLESLKRPCMCA